MRRLLLFALLLGITSLLVQPAPVPTHGIAAGVVHAQGGGGGGVRQLDGGDDGGDDGGGIVDRIKKAVTNITRIVVPARTIFDAINGVLARAGSGQLSDAVDAYDTLARQVTGAVQEQLFPTDELTAIAKSSLPLAAALAIPFFLLRLAIYHWRQLVGGDDTAAAAVGDWIIAAGWAYAAGHLITFTLKIGVEIAAATMGSVPQLVGGFLLDAAPGGGVGLSNLIGLGFLGTIIKVVTVIGMVAAVVAVLWAFAVASALSFILAATGPVAGIVGVIPQMRWLRSLWLKALVLLALFPIGAGAIFKAAALVGAVGVGGPIGTIIRLMWLWGAVGFLFALAGIAGRFSIGTGAAVGMGMVKAGKAVVDLGATAAVTGGTGLAAAGAGGGAAALSGSSGGAAGSMSSGVAGLLGSGRGNGGSRADGAPAGDTSGSAGEGSSRTTPGGRRQAADAYRQSASQSLAEASGSQRAAGVAQAFGLGRLGGVLRNRSQQAQLDARRHKLDARREDYLARYGGDNGGGDSRSGNGGFSPTSGGGPRGGAPSSPSAGGGSRGETRSDAGQSSPQRGAKPAGGPVPTPSQRASSGNVSPDTPAGRGQPQAQQGPPKGRTRDDRPVTPPNTAAHGSGTGVPQSGAAGQTADTGSTPPGQHAQQAGTQAGAGHANVADSLTSFSLSRPVRQEFAAGYRDAGGSEAAAQPAVQQLRDDLATVSGDDSTFHRFAGAGDDARDLGRLAAAYEQQQDRLPEAPADRLRQAYQTAYGNDATAHERDVPGALRDTLGGVGETTYNVDEEDRSPYRP